MARRSPSEKRQTISALQEAIDSDDWKIFQSTLKCAKKGDGDDVINWAVSRTYNPTYIRYVQALIPLTSNIVLGGDVVWSAAFVGDTPTLALLTPYADEDILQRAMYHAVQQHNDGCVEHLMGLIDCTYENNLPLRVAANNLTEIDNCSTIFNWLYERSDPHAALAYMKTRQELVTIAATKLMEQIVEQRTAEQLKNTINTAIGAGAGPLNNSGAKKL